MSELKTKKNELVVISIIILIVITFFSKLFYPHLQIFVTPDFGQSDIFQLNIPLKYFLSASLKNNELPLWNKYVGNGFPQLAEGQIGTFNVINLILFKFISFPLSFNIGYVTTFLLASVGTYLYCRSLKFPLIVSFFSSLTFAFSGFFISHIAHFNLIQTAAFLPWEFYLCELLSVRKNKILYSLLLSIVISQQLFSGFPQIVLISLSGTGLIMFYKYLTKTIPLKTLFLFVLSALLAVILSAVQILPSKELLDQSIRKDGLSLQEAFYFSFKPTHLITFVQPFALGNPQEGTYPPFFNNDGNIFWENFGYVGIMPLILLLITIPLIKKNKNILFYFILLCLSLLLMMGKYSPLYFIYSIPPFSYFRVPARFILLFVWSIVVLSSYGFDYLITITHKKIIFRYVIIFLVILSTTQLLVFSHSYHPTGKSKTWLKKPDIIKEIDKQEGKYITIESGKIWNEYFTKKGWNKSLTPYLSLQNFLVPNFNNLFNISSFQVYPILVTNRYQLINSLIISNIKPVDKETIEFTKNAISLLNLNSIQNIITTYNINPLKKVYERKNQFDDTFAYKIFQNDNFLPRARFVYNFKLIKTIEQFKDNVFSDSFDPSETVLIESDQGIDNKNYDKNSKFINSIKWVRNDNTIIELKVNTNNDGFLILTDTYYPGWKAYVDNLETQIYPAYINQKAIFVRKGEHTVTFSYFSESVKFGIIISTLSYTIIIFLAAFLCLSSYFRKSDNIS